MEIFLPRVNLILVPNVFKVQYSHLRATSWPVIYFIFFLMRNFYNKVFSKLGIKVYSFLSCPANFTRLL